VSSEGPPPPLSLSGVTFAYPHREGVPAVEDVSVDVVRGELLGLLGPNGAGKSTLLKLASGALRPGRGTVRLGGTDPQTLSRAEVARRVAVVAQREDVSFSFTAFDVVLMGRAPHLGLFGVEGAGDREQADDALRASGAWELRDRTFSELSGGEQKRVAIARALAQSADVLALDEPTAFLDVHHQIAVLDLVRARVDERALAAVMVLHDLNLAAQYCDRLLLMRDGRTVAQGTVEEVMTYRRVRDTFGVDVWVGVNELVGTRFFVPVRGSAK